MSFVYLTDLFSVIKQKTIYPHPTGLFFDSSLPTENGLGQSMGLKGTVTELLGILLSIREGAFRIRFRICECVDLCAVRKVLQIRNCAKPFRRRV